MAYRYTSEYYGVEAHGKERMHIICTSDLHHADKVLRKMLMMLGGRIQAERIVGVDVEFSLTDKDQRAAVLQLYVDKEVLVYHISAVGDSRPPRLQDFLNTEHYTYVGFSIGTDKKMLALVGIVIRPDKFIDIQREWREPNTRNKPFDSLADVASLVIDPFYKKMKDKINREEDHQRWATPPLPAELVHYAAIDAYATRKTWRHINNIKRGLERNLVDRALEAHGIDLRDFYY